MGTLNLSFIYIIYTQALTFTQSLLAMGLWVLFNSLYIARDATMTLRALWNLSYLDRFGVPFLFFVLSLDLPDSVLLPLDESSCSPWPCDCTMRN